MEKKSGHARRVEAAVSFAACAVLVVISGMTLLQVFVRYFLKIPILLSQEFVQFLFIWLVWLGAVLAVPAGSHMVIDFFRDRFLTGKANAFARLFTQLLALIFTAVVAVKGWTLARSFTMEFHTTFPLSVMYKYLSSSVGGALIFYYLYLQAWETCKELRGIQKP